MANIGLEIIKEFQKNLPIMPGIYKMLDLDKKVLYIGKAKNLQKRLKNYTSPERNTTRIQRMIFQTRFVEITTTNSEAEALLLEASLIKTLKPKYNILLRDDKTFPYIWLRTDHPYPQLTKYRGSKKPLGKVFGPFASAKDVNTTISFLQKVFLLRPCSDEYFASRQRPCLQYQIKRCSGPCTQKISQEDYQESTKETIKFLSGHSSDLQKALVKQMDEASRKLDYEEAAFLRDKIKMLTQIQMKNSFTDIKITDADILAVRKTGSEACVQVFFYRGGQSFGNKPFFPIISEDATEEEILSAFIGQIYQANPPPKEIIVNAQLEDHKNLEIALQKLYGYKVAIHFPHSGSKKQLVEIAEKNAKLALDHRLLDTSKQASLFYEIAQLFHIKSPIKRIEVYDNSHISGKFAVGAMVVATELGFQKDLYRKYTINTNNSSSGGDDYQMLREVLLRRLKRLKTEQITPEEEGWPDLLLIDGGLGHLNVAKDIISQLELDLNYVTIAKGKERNAGKEIFHLNNGESFSLNKNLEVMKYLQRIRDEAHRFAITAHRQKRAKNIQHSSLDNIEGIGKHRKKILLNHFGSIDNIKAASISELSKIPNINKNIAQKIYEYFHQD
jgi:excinuclease ABC subunit C